MDELQQLWRCAVSPIAGFKAKAEACPQLGPSLKEMLIWRVPVAILDSVLIVLAFRWQYELLRYGQGPITPLVEKVFGESSADWIRALRDLPSLPALSHIIPWLFLVAPVSILSLWIHHAVWDHTCLWILGGLKKKRGFRVSLLAEAEALKVGVWGAALGLLGSIPILGTVLSLPLFAVCAYFWVLRGFALAAFHDCPPWKGATATLLHALLLLCCSFALVVAFTVLIVQALV